MPIWLREKKDSWVVICYNWQAKFAFMPLIISLMWFICKIQNVTDFRVVHCPTWEVKKKISFFFSLPSTYLYKKGKVHTYCVLSLQAGKYDSFYSLKPSWSLTRSPSKMGHCFSQGESHWGQGEWVASKLSPATKKKQPDLFRGDFPIAFSGHARLTLCHLLA